MLYHARNATLHTDEMEMDYAVFGTGSRPLIILPGLTLRGVKGTALTLAFMYRAFTRDYRVYVLDRKADIPEGYTVHDMADDVARFMNSLDITDADVIGVSQGGMVAQYLAMDHPELVRRLVLAVTLSRVNATVREVVGQWISMAERGDHSALVRDMFGKMYSDAYLRRYRPLMPLLVRLGKPKEPKRFLRLARACLICDAYDELERIQCPVYVIGGRQDRVVTGEASEEIAERLQCRIDMYDHLGHAAYEEAPDFNARMLAFLRDEPSTEGKEKP